MPAPLPIAMAAGAEGPWRITAITAPAGAPLPLAERLAVAEADAALPPGAEVRRVTLVEALEATRAFLGPG